MGQSSSHDDDEDVTYQLEPLPIPKAEIGEHLNPTLVPKGTSILSKADITFFSAELTLRTSLPNKKTHQQTVIIHQ